MSGTLVVVVVCGLIALVLGLGFWLWSGLLLASAISLMFVADFSLTRVGSVMSSVVVNSSISWELAAIPLFVLMGEIIFRTDIAQRLFDGLAPLARLLPGGLLHTNILGCTAFSAVSGSSATTTLTVGRITIRELKQRGYDASLASGSLAGAGTLGLLIPPSISMIIYGVLANVSIMKLFAAGIIPGLMLALMYSTYTGIRCLINPSLAPQSGPRPTAGEVIQGLGKLWAVGLLIVVLLGAIYTGIATPSEAAAVGVLGALGIVVVTGQFNVRMFPDALMSTVRVSSMIIMMVATAAFMASAIAYMHLPQIISEWIATLDLTPLGLIFLLLIFYILIGTFLEGAPIIVLTLPITFPLIMQAGIDPVWFGVFLIVMMEMGTVTPPVGLNLFILQGLTGDSFLKTNIYAAPYFLILVLAILIMIAFPQIVMFLPNYLF